MRTVTPTELAATVSLSGMNTRGKALTFDFGGGDFGGGDF